MSSKKVIYRLYDDHEEKHYVLSTLTHQKLEELVEKYKSEQEQVYATEFLKYLNNFDPEAEEVEVQDLYF